MDNSRQLLIRGRAHPPACSRALGQRSTARQETEIRLGIVTGGVTYHA